MRAAGAGGLGGAERRSGVFCGGGVAMELLVIRHGLAGTREDFARTGESDDRRPLTEKGGKQIRRVGRGLRRIVRTVDVLASSPLLRARQTAEILSAAYAQRVIETDALRPKASYASFARWVKEAAKGDVVAIVGHEPHLSGLVAALTGESGDAKIALEKGGACLVHFDRLPQRGAGTLIWLLSPRVIRKLR
jgi:phosphohistidine phosphatase